MPAGTGQDARHHSVRGEYQGEAVSLHFRDIGQDGDVHDVTFENSQARERTQVLMGGYRQQTGGLSDWNGRHVSLRIGLGNL